MIDLCRGCGTRMFSPEEEPVYDWQPPPFPVVGHWHLACANYTESREMAA